MRPVFALPPGGRPALKQTVQQEREGWAGSGFGVRLRWKGPPSAPVEGRRGGCRVRWGGEGRAAWRRVQLGARRALSRRHQAERGSGSGTTRLSHAGIKKGNGCLGEHTTYFQQNELAASIPASNHRRPEHGNASFPLISPGPEKRSRAQRVTPRSGRRPSRGAIAARLGRTDARRGQGRRSPPSPPGGASCLPGAQPGGLRGWGRGSPGAPPLCRGAASRPIQPSCRAWEQHTCVCARARCAHAEETGKHAPWLRAQASHRLRFKPLFRR